jgi:hypothetical protein
MVEVGWKDTPVLQPLAALAADMGSVDSRLMGSQATDWKDTPAPHPTVALAADTLTVDSRNPPGIDRGSIVDSADSRLAQDRTVHFDIGPRGSRCD